MIVPIYKSKSRLFQSIIFVLFTYSITRGVTLVLNINYANRTYVEIFELAPRVILGGYWILTAVGLLYSFVSVRAGMWRVAFILTGVGIIHWGTMILLIRGWELYDGASTYLSFGAVLLCYTAFARDPRVNQMLRKVSGFERGHTL